MRVVTQDGEQLGIMTIQEALDTARQRELDLVEVAPEASPPVCRIMDFGKYKYTQSRRLKEARKKQTTIQVKEVKMGPKTEKHDFEFKLKHVRRFLEEGHKAKVTVRFKGREMAHTELGWKMLQKMVEAVTDIAVVESNPRMEGRMLHLIMSPKQASTNERSRHRGVAKPGCPRRWRRSMPKMKTKRAAAKRVKKTATGKFKRAGAWKQHKLEKKHPKRRRHARRAQMIAKADEATLKVLVPYL